MEKSVVAIIMAGGLGKRMESNIPKVLHKIGGISMINHILLRLKCLEDIVRLEQVLVVVGKYEKEIREDNGELKYKLNVTYINQTEPLGTGHAIQCCREELLKFPKSDVLILSGDVPFLSSCTMFNLLKNSSLVKLITTKLSNPDGYGRVITNNGAFDKIVEQKDCNEEQLEILTVNCGIYAINSRILCKHLPYIKNENKQKEFYLTDIIEIIKREENIHVGLFEVDDKNTVEIIGVNTISQLRELESLFNKKN
jgi:UDP-N-acetylglucosamine diphosphorylase/glucosamine-1-phosphate N-acetyltransferase